MTDRPDSGTELRAGVSGQVSGVPAGRRGRRSGRGRFRAWPLPPPARRTGTAACFAWVAASPAFPFSRPRSGRLACSLYFSAAPSPAPTPRRDFPPHSSRRSAGALAPAPLPGSAAGSEPSAGGHCPWEAESGGGRRKRSVFRAPLSFHGPLGNVVLPLAVRLREDRAWGLKDYKSQHPPRRERERHGAGHCWCSVVGGGS